MRNCPLIMLISALVPWLDSVPPAVCPARPSAFAASRRASSPASVGYRRPRLVCLAPYFSSPVERPSDLDSDSRASAARRVSSPTPNACLATVSLDRPDVALPAQRRSTEPRLALPRFPRDLAARQKVARQVAASSTFAPAAWFAPPALQHSALAA